MNITLYEGVELRSDYSVVFDASTSYWGTNTPFAEYLASKNYYSEEISDTYFSNDGSISISWPVYRKLPQGITYMRIFTEQNEIKYFFVNSYEYRNEVLILNYTLDVWHTYSNSMKINRGVIDRARYVPSNYRKTLPSEYETNQSLKFDSDTINKMYLVAEFQVYRLSNDTENQVERYHFTSLITQRKRNVYQESSTEMIYVSPFDDVSGESVSLFTMEEAAEAINKLTAYQGVEPRKENLLGRKGTDDRQWGSDGWKTESIGLDNLVQKINGNMALYTDPLTEYVENKKELRYELTQIFAIPQNMIDKTMFQTTLHDPVNATVLILDTITFSEENTGSSYNLDNTTWNFTEYQFLKTDPGVFDSVKTFTIPADDKVVGVGLPSLFVPIGYNNQSRTVDFRAEVTTTGFALSMLGENGISDITSHFAVPLPFTAPSGTERQLATLNKQNAKRQAKVAGIALAINTASTVYGAVKGGIQGFAGGKSSYDSIFTSEAPDGGLAFSSDYSFGEARSWGISGAVKGAAKGAGGNLANKSVGLLYQTSHLLNSLNNVKKPMSPGNASDSNPIALINAAYGFSTYSIVPINQEEIDYLISQIGYNTWINQNDYHTQNSNTLKGKYEPISFAVLHITGPFPNNIAAALENILTDGALISYDPDIFNKL